MGLLVLKNILKSKHLYVKNKITGKEHIRLYDVDENFTFEPKADIVKPVTPINFTQTESSPSVKNLPEPTQTVNPITTPTFIISSPSVKQISDELPSQNRTIPVKQVNNFFKFPPSKKDLSPDEKVENWLPNASQTPTDIIEKLENKISNLNNQTTNLRHDKTETKTVNARGKSMIVNGLFRWTANKRSVEERAETIETVDEVVEAAIEETCDYGSKLKEVAKAPVIFLTLRSYFEKLIKFSPHENNSILKLF